MNGQYEVWRRPQRADEPECVSRLAEDLRRRLFSNPAVQYSQDFIVAEITKALNEAYGFGFEDA